MQLLKDDSIYIIDGLRTPIGKYRGILKNLSIVELTTPLLSELIKRSDLTTDDVSHLFLGTVYLAGVGQNPARQCALKVGLSETIATNINQVCLSGLQSIHLAYQTLKADPDAHLIFAVGAESMSRVPYYLDNYRFGIYSGDGIVVDGLLKDGLMCPFTHQHMISCTEGYLHESDITIEEVDRAAIRSHRLAGLETSFREEILPLTIDGERFDRDQDVLTHPEEKLQQEHPVFLRLPPSIRGTCSSKEAGCYIQDITHPRLKVSSCSRLGDGASAVLLGTGKEIKKHGLTALAEILDYAEVNTEPQFYISSINKAVQKLLLKRNLTAQDIDLFEINEAFACVGPMFTRVFSVPIDKINISGGSVAIGHPLGCTGNRLVLTMIHNLRMTRTSLGMVSMCAGGGTGGAMLIRAIYEEMADR